MMKTNKLENSILMWVFIALISVLLVSCGGSSSPDNPGVDTSTTYSTTSNKGDYSEWTLSGSNLTAAWNVENDTGGVDYIYNIVATCSAEAADGTRSCSIDTTVSSCTDGLQICPDSPTGTFDLMDVPGVALFVHTSDTSYGSDQLHVGFAKNSNACTDDVTGDYTFIRTGLGLDQNIGMFRSDTNFISVAHSDFGFDDGGTATATPRVMYRSGSDRVTFNDAGCSNGVRTRTDTSGTSVDTFRAMITQSGLFLLDLPAGQGGLVAFKTDKAATVANFANKSFKGISFPDNAGPELISATSGAMSTSPDRVTLSATVGASTTTMNLSVRALSAVTTADSLTSPAYPDFTGIPVKDSRAPGPFSTNPLAMDSPTYPTVASIPGTFKFEAGLTDTGRVIAVAMIFNNKLIVVGMVYNHRSTFDTNPATGLNFNQDNLYNTGNFILFEK